MSQRAVNVAAALNLLVPGAGLVLVGAVWNGLILGLIFTALANFVLWSLLIAPDDFSAHVRGLAAGVLGGAYLAAQIRLARIVRDREQRERTAARRQALWAAREHLAGGAYAQALAALEAVRPLADKDVLVAYRFAQAYTGLGDADAAQQAWDRLQALDRHHVYREQLRAGRETLALLRAGRRGADTVPDSIADQP